MNAKMCAPVAVTLTALLTFGNNAHAQCQTVNNCSSGFATLEVNDGFDEEVGIYVVNSSTQSPNYGVLVESGSGWGVLANSTSGVGAEGVSSSNNGVLGMTSSSSAAAISAVSPSHSALAYWGSGGMNLTGSLNIGSDASGTTSCAYTGNGTACKPGGGSWNAPSDIRIKKDVKDFNLGASALERVRPVTYRYNGAGGTVDDGREYVGVIAQELEQVLPRMVTSGKAKLHKDDAETTDIKMVDPSDFTYLLINAVKEQQKTIERQDARIARLESAHAPVTASLVPGGLGGVALALVPLGFVAVRRRRTESS